MTKRLINFRGTENFARVEIRKGGGGRGGRLINGAKIVWALCDQNTGVQLAWFDHLQGRAKIKPPRGEGVAGFNKREAEREYNNLSQNEKDLLKFLEGDATGAKGTSFFGQINPAFVFTKKEAFAEPDVLGMVGQDGAIYVAKGTSWAQYSKPCKTKTSKEKKAPTIAPAWTPPPSATSQWTVTDAAESDNDLYNTTE